MEIIEKKTTLIEMRAKGYSYDKIAKQLGIAKQTLVDWSKELQDEIANLKAMELEALYESNYLLKENRLQTLGGMLSKIKEEALNRDLSSVPTDKLLELLLKYNTQINEEIVEPKFKCSTEIAEEHFDRILMEELTSLQLPSKTKKLNVV